jgi:hypothetical protein
MGARSSRCSPGKYGMPKPPPRFRKRTGAGACVRPAAAPARSSCAALRRSTRPSGSASRRRGGSPRRPAQSRPICGQQRGTCSTSTPNCLGPPPIFMPEPLSSKSGFTRTATRAGRPSSWRRRASTGSSRADSTLTSTPRPPPAQFGVALAGAGEADLGRVGAGVQRHLQLAGRGHVDAVDQPRHHAHHGRHRVGLHRVVQLDAAGSAARSSATRARSRLRS